MAEVRQMANAAAASAVSQIQDHTVCHEPGSSFFLHVNDSITMSPVYCVSIDILVYTE